MRIKIKDILTLCFYSLFVFSLSIAGSSDECNLVNYTSISCRHFSTRHGLPNANIECVAQDYDGFIWVCTQQGMARYDGQGFQVFDNFPESWSKYVMSCLFDKEDILWVGTSEGIAYYNGDRFEPLNLDDAPCPIGVKGLVETPNGDKWFFCRNQGPYCIRKGKLITSYLLPEDNEVLDIDIGPDGQVWLGTFKGLYRLEKDTFRRVSFKGMSDEILVSALKITGPSEGWLGNSPGELIHFTRDTSETRVLLQSKEDRSYVYIWDIAVRKSRVWIATNRGLFLWNGNRMEHYTVNTGLNSNQIYSVLVDREGLVWYGSDNGLGRIMDIRFRCLKPSVTLPVSTVYDLVRDEKGEIWIGTAEGLIRCRGQNVRIWNQADGMSDDSVNSVLVRHDGTILLGLSNGLERMRKGVFQVLSQDISDIFDMTNDPDGSVWLACGDGLFRLIDDRLTKMNVEVGLPDEVEVSTVFFDTRGGMWVLTNGAGVFHGSRTKFPLKHIDNLPSERAFSISEGEKGRIWLATMEGVCQLKDGRLQLVFNEKQGMASQNVWTVQVDCHGDVWMATSKGISLLKNGRIYNYNVDDGISGDDLLANCVIVDDDDRIWFGGTGITIVDPKVEIISRRPKIYLTFASVNGKPMFPGQRIPPGFNTVEFWFSCLSFANENKNMYRYQLIGYDAFRSKPTRSSYIRYMNLPSGRYRLVAEGMNRDGLWSDHPAEFTFEVMPAWWEHRWIQALGGVIFLLIVAITAHIRNARIRKRAYKLKKEVDRQTKVIKEQLRKLEEQRNRLARLAVTDDLTGVYNRRYFFTALTREWKRQNRYHHPLSLVIFDIDHFKEINDTYGHAIGDEVLIHITRNMQKMIRSSDILARFGGEEFILLLPETNLDTAKKVAERIRINIADTPLKKEAYDDIVIYVSGGISSTEGSNAALNPDALVRQADIALYEAKRKGRNRIEIYTDITHRMKND